MNTIKKVWWILWFVPQGVVLILLYIVFAVPYGHRHGIEMIARTRRGI